MVSVAAAERIRKQVSEALDQGAKSVVPRTLFPMDKDGTAFVAPQVLTDVTHEMSTPPPNPVAPIIPLSFIPAQRITPLLARQTPALVPFFLSVCKFVC